MLIIPAIDLRAGRCVRLVEGRLDKETVYSDEPATVARQWQEQGAKLLHVVDLDGAFTGAPKNLDKIQAILKSVDIPVQVGGGIREISVIEELLGMGVKRVILGTVAIINPGLVEEACKRFGEGVVLGIDARDGKVAIEGWGVTAEKNTLELAGEMKSLGVQRIIFTDIWRDGTLKGPNLAAIEEVARATGLKVIASGGISEITDIINLKKLESAGVEGVIVGKALYAGTVNLQEALSIAEASAEVKVC